ncbi:MAG: tRNA1(Val) (adenine(37)-N6)-methyltransferase [Parabacteroides sp.]
MANPYFKFKQFTVWHDQCAMKVGTDGALLGAWATPGQARRILDIGTGTGLIALMLAQRCDAQIDAIDIDADACRQARENVRRSPFEGRIAVFHAPLHAFQPTDNQPYDLIVSNPPYFIDSLKCPNNKRSLARHTDTLPLEELIQESRRLLSPTGRLCLILPFDQQTRLEQLCQAAGFHLILQTNVSPVVGSAPKRLLAEWGLESTTSPRQTHLSIEYPDRRHTEEFIALEKPYYLKM